MVLRARGAARVILAVPVGAPDVVDDLGMLADRVVALSVHKSKELVAELEEKMDKLLKQLESV